MDHGFTQATPPARGYTLTSRMLAAFSLVMLIAAGGIALFMDRMIRETTLSERGEQLVVSAESLGNLLLVDIENRLTNITARAINMSVMGLNENISALQHSLNGLQASMPEYTWIGYTSAEGVVVAATGGLLVGENVSQRPWFQAGLRGPAVVDVHEAVLLAQLIPSKGNHPLRFLDVAHPIRDKRGEVIGVLAAHLSDNWLRLRLNLHEDRSHPVSGTMLSVTSRSSATQFGDPVAESIVEKIRSNSQARGWFIHSDNVEKHSLVAFSNMEDLKILNQPLGWVSVVQIPLDVIDDVVGTTRRTIVAAIAAITLVAWLTFYWLLGAAHAPVQALLHQIDRSRKEHREMSAFSGLPREFEQVHASMNEMIRSIRANEAQLERTLDELRKSFSGVTASFPGVLFTARLAPGNRWVFSYLSPSAEHYLGVRVPSLPVDITDLMSNITLETRKSIVAALKAQTRDSDSVDLLLSIRGSGGQVRQMRASAKKRRIDASQWAWDGMMVDVSDLIEAQKQAAAADVAKSDFLASMSHEIRTPLNGILGFAQLLVHTVQDPAQKADARRIIETAEMLTVILNDVLDYSKIEAGELTLESHPFDVAELLNSCVTLFNLETQKRGIRFTVRNECPPALRLVGDPTRLRQIITNLLSNAVKFTEEGSVDIRVTAESTPAEQVALAVTVTDTGRGMSVEQQERLFQRFNQVDRAIYRQYGGSGLGLAITKRLLAAMGGDISVTSAPGQGSSFRFGLTLPIANTPVGDTPTPDQRSTEPLDILVVDDVAINREILRRMLGRDGHRVTEAASGEYAIEAARQRRFDMILMDIEMPGMDGLAACRQLRAETGPNRNTYIVALTGYAFDADIEKAMDAGMDAHMAKPIMMQALHAQIEKYRASRPT